MNSCRVPARFFTSVTCALALAVPTALRAADHGDAPTLGPDQGCDLADVYAFLDQNNNDRVVLIGTVRGFIVPSEANNFGLFDPTARFTFAIENTGDAKPDLFIDLDFSPRAIKQGASSPSQDATVSFRGAVPAAFRGSKGKFDPAPVTQPTLAATANAQIITNLTSGSQPSGIQFFAGEVDDPFFFDIVGFNRFVAGVLASDPNAATNLDRGRDSFAGYNVMGFALSMPATLLRSARPSSPTIIGASLIASRATERTIRGTKVPLGVVKSVKGAVDYGIFSQVDRMGVPGVNVAFIPYNRKNAYNGATTLDDARGVFAQDIVGTLVALGASGGFLQALASTVGLPPGRALTDKPSQFGTGDFLRLETDKVKEPNTGPFSSGFPNGRRLTDDVIDVIITLVTNSSIMTGDHVGASDVAPQGTFPFLALPQQPRSGAGNVEDNTRN